MRRRWSRSGCTGCVWRTRRPADAEPQGTMKTQYYTASSLDGFIADERNSLEWLFQFGEGPGGDYDRFIADVGAIAMGSTTYEWILEHLVHKDPARPQPWPYSQPSWIFTT